MDQSQAEEAMYRPMRALRKMLRTANKWAIELNDNHSGRILNQAPFVHGVEYSLPEKKAQGDFMVHIFADPTERLIFLKEFVEG
jgi:hypothetical protein